jgi:hypothetical protein
VLKCVQILNLLHIQPNKSYECIFMCMFHSVTIYVHINLCLYWTDSYFPCTALFMDIICFNNKQLFLLVLPMWWVIFKEGVDILNITQINLDLKQAKQSIDFWSRAAPDHYLCWWTNMTGHDIGTLLWKILYRQESFNSGWLLRIWWYLELSNISVVMTEDSVSVFITFG